MKNILSILIVVIALSSCGSRPRQMNIYTIPITYDSIVYNSDTTEEKANRSDAVFTLAGCVAFGLLLNYLFKQNQQ